MVYSNLIIPLINLSTFKHLPMDIILRIHSFSINHFAQIIINKWFSFIQIHNTNLCYIANRIPILQNYTIFGDTILYYNLKDKNLYFTLSICNKYIKPSISDIDWWSSFIQYAFNGLIFCNNFDSDILNKLFKLSNILGCFKTR